MFEQAEQLQAIFIGHPRLIGGETPMRAKLVAFIEAEGQVGIANINGEKHLELIVEE